MEDTLGVVDKQAENAKNKRLNPYSNGIISDPYDGHFIYEGLCLNPYSNGRYSRRQIKNVCGNSVEVS